MKTGSAAKISGAKTAVQEEKIRRSLQILQPAATDKENLVGGGRTLRSTIKEDLKKNEMSSEKIEKVKNDTFKKKKIVTKDKAVQTPRGDGNIKVEVEDLTSEAGPSENYWQIIAERRRLALEDALEENEKLYERISKLEDENRIYKEMLEESRNLVEVLQEMVGEDQNDINNSVEDYP